MTTSIASRIARFIDTHDRLPLLGDGYIGGTGAPWLIEQRTALGHGLLADALVERFDRTIPGWSIPYDTILTSQRAVTFHRRTIACADHFDQHGSFPTKTAKEADLARLGEWLRQMRNASRGVGKSTITAERIALFDRLIPGWDTSKSEVWVARACDIEAFIDEHGFFPRASAQHPEEQRMSLWLFHNGNAIFGDRRGGATWQHAYLDRHLPGWDLVRRSRTAAYWEDRFAAAVEYLAAHGRLPNGHDEGTDEQLLTRWLLSVRRDRTGGNEHRAARLHRALPGWRGVRESRPFTLTRDGRWEDNFMSFQAFLSAHGRLPSARVAASLPEKFLRAWMVRQRLTADPNRCRRLDEVAPGWEKTVPRARPNVPIRGGLEESGWMAPRAGDVLSVSGRHALVLTSSLAPRTATDVRVGAETRTLAPGARTFSALRTAYTVRLAGATRSGDVDGADEYLAELDAK